MRNRKQLTNKSIMAMKNHTNRQIEYYDSVIPAFGVRVSPFGIKSFFLLYKIGGKSRRLTIGRFPALSLADARSQAQQAKAQIAKGIDPAAKKREANRTYNSMLFPVVVGEFIEKHAKRKTRGADETLRLLRREFKAWDNFPIHQIAKRDVLNVIDGISAPGTANHAFAAVRKLFNWCIERDYLAQSPCERLSKPFDTTERDRVLNDAELGRVLRGLIPCAIPSDLS